MQALAKFAATNIIDFFSFIYFSYNLFNHWVNYLLNYLLELKKAAKIGTMKRWHRFKCYDLKEEKGNFN